MKYCGKCKHLLPEQGKGECPVCGRELISDPSPSSPVRLVTANGFELERICAALKSEGVPCTYQETRRDAGLQILNAAPPENCDIFVPVSAYEEAADVLIGIGALKEEDLPRWGEADAAALKAVQGKEDEEDLPNKKAKAVRIASAILFLALIAAAVWLADILCEWVPRLISGA